MQGGGYGAPPGGYGQPPGGFNPPPAGYGAPPTYAQPPRAAPPPKAGGHAGLWIVAILGLLLLFAGIAGAAVYFLVFAKPAPHLAKYMPKTTSVYVEIPGVKKSLISAAKMKPFDSSRVDEKQVMEDTVNAFASSFSMTDTEARAVVDGIDAAAFGMRDTNTSGKAVGLIAFSSTQAADKLLRSKRFNEKGSYGSVGGMRYELDSVPYASRSAHANILELTLSGMAMSGTRNPIVWFPKTKLLAFGDTEMMSEVDGVINGSTDSLEKNESYNKAKRNFESGSDVAFFFDTHDLDDVRGTSSQKLLEGYIHNRDPITGAVKIVKAGLMMDVHATFSGGALPPEDLVAHASKLAFPHKLPADTVAYMAMSTKTKMTAAAVRTTLIERVGDSDPSLSKDLRDAFDEMERSLGFSFMDVVDMTGDEAAFAIVVDPAFKLDSTNGLADEIGNVGIVYALAVKDDAKARMILGKLQKKLEDKDLADFAKVRSLGKDSFEVDPQTTSSYPIPNLTVKYDGKQIIVVLANPGMSNRAFDALQNGKGTLGSDSAHELAFGALPQDANFYMWLDTGRITSVMLDGVSHVRKGGASSLFPVEAIRLTGPDRVTSALALRATAKDNVWSIDLDSLNMPAMSLFSVASELNLSTALPSGPVFGK